MKSAPLSLPTGLLVLGALVVGGCASYPSRTAGALRDFREGRLASSREAFADDERTKSSFLSGAEAGTVALTGGDWDAALEYFHAAASAAQEFDERGALGAESLAEGLASWALNDTAQAYQGEGFERVYVHTCLALAYLAKGQLEDVYVEARLANELLETEEKLYEKEYAAGGLGHFVSALAYELLGEPDQAYVDYRRMAEKSVGTGIAGPALLRLGELLRRDEDLPTWRERFGEPLERPPGAASVVVVAGVGLSPFKIEGNLLIPGKSGLVAIAVPAFQARPQPVEDLRLVERASGTSVLADVLERVDEIGPANLSDRLLWTATKSVARGLGKRELTRALEDNHGVGGRVVGDLFAAFSERADLRSWTTLPASWQAARMWVPAGEVDLVLEAVGGQAVDLGRFALESGETMIVLARSVGTRLHAHAIGGALIAPPLAETLDLESLAESGARGPDASFARED